MKSWRWANEKIDQCWAAPVTLVVLLVKMVGAVKILKVE